MIVSPLVLLTGSFRRALLWLAGVVVALGLILAALGVRDLAHSDPIFLGDPLLRVIRLISFRSSLDLIEAVPVTVHLARWTLLVGVVLLATYLTLRLLRRPLEALVISRQRDHVVVCGEKRRMDSLIPGLTATGRRVVAVLQGAPAASARRPEIAILRGDPTRGEDLERAAAHAAQSVFALGSSSASNLAVAASLEKLCDRLRPQAEEPVRCVVEIHDDRLRQSLSILQPAAAGRRMERRFLFRERAIARALLQDHPPVRSVDIARGQRIRVLIVSATGIAQQILLELLRAGMIDERGPEIVVLDDDATGWGRALMDQYPGIDRICSLELRDLQRDRVRSQIAEMLRDADRETLTAVYLCSEEFENSMALAATVQAAAGDALVALPRMYLHTRAQSRLVEELILGTSNEAPVPLTPFGSDDALYSAENLLEERRDLLARAVQEQYLEELRRQGKDVAESPAGLPWRDLAETYRDACRYQADHAEVKLRCIGCHSVAGPPVDSFAFTDEEIEALARLEHVRWMADRYLQGWTYAEVRDNARRRHPALVPYDRLPDELQELDRSAVRSLPELFARVGRSIERVSPTGSTVE